MSKYEGTIRARKAGLFSDCVASTCPEMQKHVLRLRAQQPSYFVLDSFEFAQVQLRIAHDKDVTIVAMFINQETIATGILCAHLLEHALAFEHYGENETGVRRRIILNDQT